MKKFIALFLLMISMQLGFGQHFETVWSGGAYNGMQIYVTGATLDGVDMEVGDEIAVFDVTDCGSEFCVGTVTLDGPITPMNFKLITASANDADPGREPNGFTSGNDIIFRYWDNSEQKEIVGIVPTYYVDANFTDEYLSNGSASASLAATNSAVVEFVSTSTCEGGGFFEIPVQVYGMQNVTSFNFVFEYDTDAMADFNINYTAPGFNGITTSDNNGIVTVTWNGGPSSINNDVLFTFFLSSESTGMTCLNWDKALSAINAGAMTSSFIDGGLYVSQAPVISSVTPTHVSCNGGSDGKISVVASGTSDPLKYSIDDGVTWQTATVFNNLVAGDYNLIVRDNANCETTYANNPIVITEPVALVINSVAVVQPTCFGEANGSITVNASGGTGALQYSFDDGATWQAETVLSDLSNGNYNVIVKDANGCETAYAMNPIIISQPAELVINSVSKIDVVGCFGETTGEIQIDAFGGTAPITYSIDDGTTWQAGNTFSNLAAGNYQVVVKDNNDCQTTYVNNPVVISQPTELSIDLVESTDVTVYNGNDGTITITASGGTAPLVYSIDDGTTWQANNVFNTLTAGDYHVWVKDDNDCQEEYAANPVVIDQPGQVQIDDVTSTDVTGCFGNANGTIQITASGGLPPYLYSINDGVTWQAANLFELLIAGDYVVKVKDDNDFIVTYDNNPVTIAQPTEVEISNLISTDVTGCFGNMNGEIEVTTIGGDGTYMYSIDDGATWQAGNTFAGLAADSYTVKVKDGNDCEMAYDLNPVIISQPTEVEISNLIKTDVTGCFGNMNGEIEVTAMGGDGTYMYSIDDGATWQVGNTFSGLAADSYTVKVKDGNNCETAYIHNPITILQPQEIVINLVNVADVTGCYGNSNGEIEITAAGGTGAFTYSIDDGGTWQVGNTFAGLTAGSYDVWVKDANDCLMEYDNNPVVVGQPIEVTISSVNTVDVLSCYGNAEGEIHIVAAGGTGVYTYSIDDGATWQASGDFVGLTAGDYTVTVKDGNDCQKDYINNPVTIAQPTEVEISNLIKTDVTGCFGNMNGEIEVTAMGGDGNYMYSIDDGATWQAGNTFAGLAADSYTVKVKDGNDCEAAYDLNPVIISQPTEVEISNLIKTDVIGCFGNMNGEIEVTAMGGDGTYMYSMDDGATWQAGNTFSGLAADSYTVKVKDGNNCETAYIHNPVTINQPQEIVINPVNVTDVTGCYGNSNGEIEITAAGGTGAFTYSIEDGGAWQAGNTFAGLAAGNFNVWVTDANDCLMEYYNNPVMISEPDEITISEVVVSGVSNFGADDASIEITAAGGTGILNYSIDGGVTWQQNNLFEMLAPGDYFVQVKDANDCLMIYPNNPVVIDDSPELAINDVVVTDVDGCYGDLTGGIFIDASNGANIIFYTIDCGVTWYEGQNTFTDLAAGEYCVQVKNIAGTIVEYDNNPVIVSEPSELVITNGVVENVTCYGGTNGGITITAEGGTAPYTYSVDNGGTWSSDPIFDDLSAGTYSVWIEDDNGCMLPWAANPVIISQPEAILISSLTANSPSCYNADNGVISIGASGGTGMLQYSIDDGVTWSNSGYFYGLVAGEYHVVLKDENDCLLEYVENPVVLINPDLVEIQQVMHNNVMCNGVNDGVIEVVAVGGSGQLFYSIDNVAWQEESIFEGLAPGNYEVRVKDEHSCLNIFDGNPVVIIEPTAIAISDVTPTDVNCYGGSDGTFTISAAGGTGSLQYSVDNGTTWQTSASFTDLTAGFYEIAVKDENDCLIAYEMNPVEISQPDEITITGVSASDVSCHDYSDGEIEINAAGGTGSFTYSVNDGSTWQSANVFNGLSAGDYLIWVKDENDCMMEYANNPVTINNPDEVEVSIVADPGNEVYINHFVELSGSSNYDVDYLWQPGGATSQTIEVTSSEVGDVEYELSVTNENGCSATATIVVTYLLNIATVDLDNEVNVVVFPNPSNGKFNLTMEGISCDFDIFIYNAFGNLVSRRLDQKAVGNFYQSEFNLENTSAGIYYIKIVTCDKEYIRKVIITN